MIWESVDFIEDFVRDAQNGVQRAATTRKSCSCAALSRSFDFLGSASTTQCTSSTSRGYAPCAPALPHTLPW